MAVTDQDIYFSYVGDASTTIFPFLCRILESDDLTVMVAKSVQSLGSDYSLNGVGTADGGEVVFVTPPAIGTQVELERIMPIIRETDFQNSGDFRAETVNFDLDRAIMLIQQADKRRQLVIIAEMGAGAAPTVVYADAGPAQVDVNLPTSGEVIIIKTDNTANPVRILPAIGATVLRGASVELTTQDESIHLIFNAANWQRI